MNFDYDSLKKELVIWLESTYSNCAMWNGSCECNLQNKWPCDKMKHGKSTKRIIKDVG